MLVVVVVVVVVVFVVVVVVLGSAAVAVSIACFLVFRRWQQLREGRKKKPTCGSGLKSRGIGFWIIAK
jgi:uncharacterized membrane protein YdfJ with MMPL/SSD domain